jgi:hypothetical protein
MKKVTLALLALCFFSAQLQAGSIDFGTDRANKLALSADGIMNRAGNKALGFDIHVGNLDANDVETEGGTFTLLTIPGFQHSPEVGAPSLPVMNKIIEIPVGAELDVQTFANNVKTYKLEELGVANRLMPRQAPKPKDGTVIPFAMNKRVYNAKGFYQVPLAEVEYLGTLRDKNLALLKVAPVTYDAATGEIEVYHDVNVKVTLKGSSIAQTLNLKNKYSSRSFNALSKDIVVPESLQNLNVRATERPVHYLIVSHEMFKNDLVPFVQWKKEKGFNVTEAYTDEIGGTKEAVKAYIHDLYNNPGEKGAPDFVLFVGDHNQIPAFRGKTGSHISDLYYVAVTDDNLPDILTGRFSAQNSEQLLPQIAKTIEYEKFETANPEFAEKITLIAGWDSRFTFSHGWPQLKYGLAQYFDADHGLEKLNVYLSDGSHQNEDAIFEAIDAGCTLVNYTAHGSSTTWADPSFTKADISALENKGMYPLVIGNCCLTNKFEVSTCFGEAWLRAENRGAIGYIGGTNSTYWDEDLWWGVGFYPIQNYNPNGTPPEKEDTGVGAYDATFEGPHYTMAGMILAGNLAVQASNSPRKHYYWEVYELMGDPSLVTYWGIPGEMNVTADVTDDGINISAPNGAYVGLTTADGELVGAGTVKNGATAIRFNRTLPRGEKIKVVVTAKDIKPYIGIVTAQ